MESGNLYINLEPIYYSAKSIVFKASHSRTGRHVIIKSLNKAQNDDSGISQIKKEYEFLTKLQGEYVVGCLDCLDVDKRCSIVLEELKGLTLQQYTQTNRLGLVEYLDIAIQIAKCLDYIHQHRIIHKDINPTNIIYNPIDKSLKLIDFGLASEFSSGDGQTQDFEKLEGTLPYISPEQTGKMNIALDYRTDFYSLGVTLYELACNELPYYSSDPSEMVYYHIAVAPKPLHELNPLIPKAVSSIISKLMAKIPGERYKSAVGIVSDLQKCKKEYKEKGCICEFIPGSEDRSDKYELYKELYGRENEYKKLLTAFESTIRGNTRHILIGGYSGIGKTSLVNELKKPVIEAHGIFISGKFADYTKNLPFFEVLQAIDQFCTYILCQPDSDIRQWREHLIETLGERGRLISETLPRFELIVGKQAPLKKLSAIDEQNRFKSALKDLIIAIASLVHPLVLFMDDVHLASAASLELIENIILDSPAKGLLVIGTYRDNELPPGHRLYESIEKLKEQHGKIELIKLNNLDIDSITQMIADSVGEPPEKVLGLARVVFEKTMGNPYYTIEFLKYCNREKLLYFDRNTKKWKWDAAEILERKIADNVADYLIGKFKLLPDATKELVSIASCIGNSFDITILSAITNQKPEVIIEKLKSSITEEMLYVSFFQDEDIGKLQFRFCHDKFQQAGYQALSCELRQKTHLSIARYFERTVNSKNSTVIFMIAKHYLEALGCIQINKEKEKVVKVFLRAAHCAILKSEFDIAKNYYEKILQIAPGNLLKKEVFLLYIYKQYHLTLNWLAQYDEMDEVYLKIRSLAKEPMAMAYSCCTQFVSYSCRGQYEKAYYLGISLAEELGLQVPQNISEAIDQQIKEFYEKGYSKIEHLEKLGLMKNPCDRAIAETLFRLLPVGFFYNPPMSLWAIIKTTNMMLEKGLSDGALEMSSCAFMILSTLRNDYVTGYKIAKKIIEITRQPGFFHPVSGSIINQFAFFICHWFESIENDVRYAKEALQLCLKKGEHQYASYAYYPSLIALLECCPVLTEMAIEVEEAVSSTYRSGNMHALAAFVTFRQLTKALGGEIPIQSFEDDTFNEQKHVESILDDQQGLCLYYIYRSLLAVLNGDFKTCFHLTEKAAPILSFITGYYSTALHNFLYSLSICRIMEQVQDQEKQRLLAVLENNQAWLLRRAEDAPFNFRHLYDLIEAEIKASQGNFIDSFRFYAKSALGAKENKRPYHYALACELAGKRYLALGIQKSAEFHLKEAYASYFSWKAFGKTEKLKKEFPQILFAGMDIYKPEKIISSQTSNIVDIIDLKDLIKATQAISGEIQRKRLLQKLMQIIMENSGGNNGCVLQKVDKNWILSAYRAEKNSVKPVVEDRKIHLEEQNTDINLPLSIFSYVIRTKEPLIIGSIPNSPFFSDNYFRDKAAASVMCFPILYHKAFKGIIYLENELLTEAFSTERLNVLSIFASQAAISLENSLLYSNLEKKVLERTKQLSKTNLKLSNEMNERRLAQEATMDANQRYAELVNNLSVGIYRRTPGVGGIFLEANPAIIEMFGAESKEELSKYPFSHYYKDLNQAKELNDRLLQKGFLQDEEIEIRSLKGRVFWASATGIMKKNRLGEIYFDGIITDITQRKLADEKLKELSLKDELTGLNNRRGFLTLASQQIKVAERLNHHMMLVYMDIDRMKWINDTYGHSEGDQALVDVAGILKNTFRTSDIISRFGGDEFVALVMDGEENSEETLKQRLQKNMEYHNQNTVRPYKLSVSVGIAAYLPKDACSLNELIEQGDMVMYENKLRKRIQR